ncbi:MAG TPA: O-antigen ligase family protein [Opitutaceae bacterium]|jgi:O-antigen ligase|nr:O-antigen ligase family protein [Opitutaceae bacterium]
MNGASSSSRHGRKLSGLEVAVLVHVGIFLAAAAWIEGGSPVGVREGLAAWGSLSVPLFLAAVLPRASGISARPGLLRWLWPLALFNGVTLAACLTPNYREVHFGAQVMLTPLTLGAWPPSTAVPALTLHGLWLFDAIYLSCFNLALVARRRRGLRTLLVFAALNAAALGVFGTIQRLTNAPSMYFGMLPHENLSFFFATFAYHNHWGSFALLMIVVCLGLGWHYFRQTDPRQVARSPAIMALLGAALLALTEPLSASRSCTLLLLPVAACALGQWMTRLVRQRRRFHESVAAPLAAALAGVAAIAAAGWMLAGNIILTRLDTTREQLAAMSAHGANDSMIVRYRDTWHMALDKFWFGWGMDSYPHVFMRYNSQLINPADGLYNYYYNAHNDWLQSLSEHGLAGTVLIAACGLVPLGALRGHRPGLLAGYLLFGCGLILLYSLVEFPFDNPCVALSWWLCFFAAIAYVRLSERSTPAEPAPA